MATLEQPDAGAPSRRRIGTGMLIGMIVAAIFALLAGGVLIGSVLSARQVSAELARIRAAGEPITPAALDAFYALPAGQQDTTELWLAALAALDASEYQIDAKPLPVVGEGGEIPPLDEPWPEMDAVEAFLAKYREPLNKMHQAADLGGAAQFPIEFADGIALQLKHVQQLRGAVRLLTLELEIHARRGDAQGAAQSLRTILATARSLQRQPIIVSQLVRVALNWVACKRLERLLPALRFSDTELARLDRDLAAIDYDAALRRALLGERAILFQHFADPTILGDELPAVAGWGPLRNMDRAAFLLLMKKYIDASQATQIPLHGAMSQAAAEVTAVLQSPSARWRYPITRFMTPSSSAFFNALCCGKAQRDVARSAIAIERYRRIHGELPQTLDALVPDLLPKVPADPFDGAPLRYLRTDSGCKIYSVGQDRIDQQGAEGEPGELLDITFEFKVPASEGGGGPVDETQKSGEQ